MVKKCPKSICRYSPVGYITNITKTTEVQMDLLLIIALSLSFWLGLLILGSMAEIIHRTESDRKRFDKQSDKGYINNTFNRRT